MVKNETAKKIKQVKFIKNNGAVLRTVNLLRYQFVKMTDALYATELDESAFLDSVNYLVESGYVQLRDAKSKVAVNISDKGIELIEGKLTDKGIKLLAGVITDELIDV